MLSYIKYSHRDRKCIADQIYSNPHLYEILEKHPSVHVVHIVSLCYHADQLVTEHKCNDNSCNRHYDRIGQVLYHTENTTVPPLWGLPYLGCNFTGLLIDLGEHGVQVRVNNPCQKTSHPFLDRIKNLIEHGRPPLLLTEQTT